MAIRLSEVTEVDRRTARRVGLDPEKVNMVLNVWAEQYLILERETPNGRVADAEVKPPRKRVNPAAAKTTAAPPPSATFSHSEPSPGTETPTEGAETESAKAE